MRARFVVCANGTLSKPKLPKIPGLDRFEGHSFHTSRWDYAYTGSDLSSLGDKVVGIIGTGASAVQAIPHLGANAKELYVFQRTPSMVDVKNDWPTDPEWAAKLEPGWQAKRRERALEREGPMLGGRGLDEVSKEEKLARQEQANVDYVMRIHAHIDEIVEDPATAEALKPWYMFMCKRPCFDNAYLPAYNRPNVHLVDTRGKGINEIAPAGPVFEGRVYPLDLLVVATGFEVQKTGIYNRIVGEKGLDLNDKYAEGIRTVLGIHSHGFPNLFIMGGYQASFKFNLTDVLQVQGDHIARCIAYAREHGHTTIDARPETEDWWVQEVIDNRGKTSRSADCTPGYYNFEGEFQRRQDGNYKRQLPPVHRTRSPRGGRDGRALPLRRQLASSSRSRSHALVPDAATPRRMAASARRRPRTARRPARGPDGGRCRRGLGRHGLPRARPRLPAGARRPGRGKPAQLRAHGPGLYELLPALPDDGARLRDRGTRREPLRLAPHDGPGGSGDDSPRPPRDAPALRRACRVPGRLRVRGLPGLRLPLDRDEERDDLHLPALRRRRAGGRPAPAAPGGKPVEAPVALVRRGRRPRQS